MSTRARLRAAARRPAAADGSADRGGLQVGKDELARQRSRATAAATGDDRRQAAAAAQRSPAHSASGRSTRPLYVTAPPGDKRRVFVVEQGGRDHACCVGGKRRAAPVPRPVAATSRPAASRACCRWRSRPTTRARGRFYVYFTDRNGDTRVQEFRRSAATRTAPTSHPARRSCSIGGPVPEPQRRAAAVRPRRPALHRHWATAAPAATPRTAPRT